MLKVCGDWAPRMIRCGSPTPAMTALTSECTGLIEATTRSPASGPVSPSPPADAAVAASASPNARIPARLRRIIGVIGVPRC